MCENREIWRKIVTQKFPSIKALHDNHFIINRLTFLCFPLFRIQYIMKSFLFHLFVNRNYFGESHQKYADTLLDYGFFLLNVDDIVRSVHAYTVKYNENN